jgi:hypothetical protein
MAGPIKALPALVQCLTDAAVFLGRLADGLATPEGFEKLLT